MSRLCRLCLVSLVALVLVLPLPAAAAEGAAHGIPRGTPAPFSPLFGRLSPPLARLLDPAPPRPAAGSGDEPPVLGRPDARVLRFGERIPRLRCLPYRACSILLAPGETILHLAVGDSERWQVDPVAAPASSPDEAPVLVFKPLAYNLLTDLVVRTDRRLYVLELLSPRAPGKGEAAEEEPYDALVEFSYPHAWSRRVGRAVVPGAGGLDRDEHRDAGDGDREASREAPAGDPSHLCFEYRFHRPLWPSRRLRWTPDVVYDDGHRTYLHLPPAARRHDLPAVLVVGDGGKASPTDTTLTTLGGPGGQWLVVPEVAGRLELVVGSGRKARRLTIERKGR